MQGGIRNKEENIGRREDCIRLLPLSSSLPFSLGIHISRSFLFLNLFNLFSVASEEVRTRSGDVG